MAERALNSILTDINTQIKTVAFGSKITTRGLCYLQEKDDKTFPIENVNTRNANKISWDDKYPLQTYHRILNVEKEKDPTQGFGKNVSRTTVYSMRLVGIGSKGSLSVAAYEDNQEIAKTVEAALPQFLNTNEFLDVESLEVIKQNVYDSEWPGVEMKKLSLEGIAFWIDYTLKITGCESGTPTSTSTVRNSDSTYSGTVNCNQTLVLPDITITKLDDTTITYPSAKNIDIGDIDSCTAPTTWAALVALIGRGYNYPHPTGQTVSYRTGDDANIEATIFTAAVRAANGLKAINSLADITTLNNTNAFGNLNRFTYIDGTQTYTTNYKIDHYTGLAWDLTVQSSLDFNGHIDGALASSFEGFTDWFLPNIVQMRTMHNSGDGNFGLSFLSNGVLATSTTNDQATTQNFITQSNNRILNTAKTSTNLAVYCRKHY